MVIYQESLNLVCQGSGASYACSANIPGEWSNFAPQVTEYSYSFLAPAYTPGGQQLALVNATLQINIQWNDATSYTCPSFTTGFCDPNACMLQISLNNQLIFSTSSCGCTEVCVGAKPKTKQYVTSINVTSLVNLGGNNTLIIRPFYYADWTGTVSLTVTYQVPSLIQPTPTSGAPAFVTTPQYTARATSSKPVNYAAIAAGVVAAAAVIGLGYYLYTHPHHVRRIAGAAQGAASTIMQGAQRAASAIRQRLGR